MLRRFVEPSYPQGRGWDEPVEEAAREGRFHVAADVDGAEQVICATGFKPGFARRPAARPARRRARARDGGTLDRPRGRLDRSRRSPTGRERSRSPAYRPMGVPGGRHAGRDEGRRAPLRAGWCRVLHAEGPDRDAAGGRAPAGPRRRRARAVCTNGGRSSSSGLMLASGSPSTSFVYHPLLPYQPAWLAVPLGLLELGLTMAPHALLELGGAAPAGGRLLRGRVAMADPRSRGPAVAPAHLARTAASSAARAHVAAAAPVALLAASASRGRPSRRRSASPPGPPGPLVLDRAQTAHRRDGRRRPGRDRRHGRRRDRPQRHGPRRRVRDRRRDAESVELDDVA